MADDEDPKMKMPTTIAGTPFSTSSTTRRTRHARRGVLRHVDRHEDGDGHRDHDGDPDDDRAPDERVGDAALLPEERAGSVKKSQVELAQALEDTVPSTSARIDTAKPAEPTASTGHRLLRETAAPAARSRRR